MNEMALDDFVAQEAAEEHFEESCWDVPFEVADDSSAEWAMRKVLEREAERDRLLALVDDEEERLRIKREKIIAKCDNETGYLRGQLQMYMNTVKCRELKASRKYSLLSGTLVMKKGGTDFKRDDDALVKWLEQRGMYGMITLTKKPCWGELKKLVEVNGNAVVLAGTGEVVEGVSADDKPDVFVIEEAKQ